MEKISKIKTKKCIYCKTKIPLEVKVCPNCNKKQTLPLPLTIFYISTFIIIYLCISSLKSNTPKSETYTSFSQLELDKLQQLYIDFDPSFTYMQARNFIIRSNLPYSEIKYNGSRVFQIAFTKGCTAQKYKKESGDYVTISYGYPKGENSKDDHLGKYTFESCSYVPTDALKLTECKDINYISSLGNMLEFDPSITKEEQMLYYYNNKHSPD